uniref:C2H2-type domain-containing protein n=2 Tax=Denticeps clupeoides TaxID=299321 RepID=A0AAY3ZXY4_9TELE
MSEVIVAFQSQLSGVMETVFKAAMFEITRLVEDSFLEEVSRSREQVETLKKRLQLCENRRRARCARCGQAASSDEERNGSGRGARSETAAAPVVRPADPAKGRCPKRERATEGAWSSCVDEAADLAGTRGPGGESDGADVEKEKVDPFLKEESLRNVLGLQQTRWNGCAEGPEESDSSAQCKDFGEQLRECQEQWNPGLGQGSEPDPDGEGEDLSELSYKAHYSMEVLDGFDRSGYSSQGLDMRDLDELPDSTALGSDVLSYGAMLRQFTPDLGLTEGGNRRTRASCSQKGKKGTLCAQDRSMPASQLDNTDTTGANCLLINEDGYLQETIGMCQTQAEPPGGAQKGQTLHPRNSPEELYEEDFSHTLALNEGLEKQIGGEETRQYTCRHCQASFHDSRALKTHLLSHRGGSNTGYSCSQCGKTFTQACNLKVHQRIHLGEGLHLCTHCGKGFASFSDLQKHRCGSTVDKPFSCSLCGNKFSRLWNLKLHRRIHTQEKPHCCTLCDKSFTRADILKVHFRTHTGERPYCCTICGLSFKRLDHLKSHQRKHKPDTRN